MKMNNQHPISEIKAQCRKWRDAGQLYYCVAEIRFRGAHPSLGTEVYGHLGIAPDSQTIILYPVYVSRYGHWGKTQVRKQMQEVKRELIATMLTEGYTKKMLTRPIEMKSLEYR